MKNQTIYVISDSVGETADLVVKAALSQFDCTSDIKRVPYVEDAATITEIVSLAKEHEAIVCFTLVKPEMRIHLLGEAKKQGVETFDIVGPLIDKMQQHMNIEPRYKPGIVHRLDEDYFDRIEAIEFAVKYDDGRDPRGILRADIVLVGVSRTSKTPLSQYLAHKRIKVANVPLVPEVDPPEELFLVSPSKCIGLKTSPEKLNSIRTERLKSLGLKEEASYARIERIEEELKYFDQIVNRIGCRVIDVTDKAVEETASIIMSDIRNEII